LLQETQVIIAQHGSAHAKTSEPDLLWDRALADQPKDPAARTPCHWVLKWTCTADFTGSKNF